MKHSTAKKHVSKIAITPEQRYHMVNDAAYFRAMKHRQETGGDEDDAESWCEIESEIDSVLKRHHAE
jgi:hypothetical protein